MFRVRIHGRGGQGVVTAAELLSLAAFAGTELALEHLGRPLPGAALLGGLAALTGVVSLRSLLTAIDARFTGRPAEGNSKAAVTCLVRELLDA